MKEEEEEERREGCSVGKEEGQVRGEEGKGERMC